MDQRRKMYCIPHMCRRMATCLIYLKGFWSFQATLSLMWSRLIEMFLRRGIGNRYHSLCIWLFPTHLLFLARLKRKWHLLCHSANHEVQRIFHWVRSPFALCSLSPLSFFVLLLHCVWLHEVHFVLFIHVYTYISRHMFLVSHSPTQCLRYSLSNGCWLKKDPLNVGGVFRTPPIRRPFSTGCSAEVRQGKAPWIMVLKGSHGVFLGRKQILTLTVQFHFKDFHKIGHFGTWQSTGVVIMLSYGDNVVICLMYLWLLQCISD